MWPLDVVLPQSGLEVSEGTVVALDVAVGDRVAEGEPLLEVETDKALSEVVAPPPESCIASRSRWGTPCRRRHARSARRAGRRGGRCRPPSPQRPAAPEPAAPPGRR